MAKSDASASLLTAIHQSLITNHSQRCFTLPELLVVMMIIAILTGLLFPTFQGVREQAKRLQARNDLTQIVNAIQAYYTEYGRYPLSPLAPTDLTYGSVALSNDLLFNVLRGIPSSDNPRGIVFIAPPEAKNPNDPHSGISSSPSSFGQFFDPWGNPYVVRIDTDYDNQIRNPYSQNAGSTPLLRADVIAWSIGKDRLSQSTASTPIDKNSATNKDDIVSWQ
jgi:prepilin-type N-terminal cleavage/methylation domain-containing protein